MIAILGATGTIGRSVARVLGRDAQCRLVLFAREPSRLASRDWGANIESRALDCFHAAEFDLVVNAIGAGDPSRVRSLGAQILDLTHSWDQRVLDTMGPHARYVFISSGAVYGEDFPQAVDEASRLSIPVNDLATVRPYSLAKLYAEARHRYAADRAILDVRVFGYADPLLPLDGGFFLCELARSVAAMQPFVTTSQDMVRDYAGAEELASLIRCWTDAGAPNAAFDLYTLAPVSKREILDMARARYALDVQIVASGGPAGARMKSVYASQNRLAATVGYKPGRSAAEIVIAFLDAKAAG